jgi:nucleotide-binding universal stress UspA family protein
MKILLAIDGSPCSDAAVAEVTRLPWPPQSEVRVVTVDAPIQPGLLRGSPATVFDEIVRQQRAEENRRLRDVAATIAEAAPSLRVTSTLLEGWPKDAIVAEAERWAADLVVVGSHGYGPIRRFFLGSISLYVAHHAPCSVLVVRRPAASPQAGEAAANP